MTIAYAIPSPRHRTPNATTPRRRRYDAQLGRRLRDLCDEAEERRHEFGGRALLDEVSRARQRFEPRTGHERGQFAPFATGIQASSSPQHTSTGIAMSP